MRATSEVVCYAESCLEDRRTAVNVPLKDTERAEKRQNREKRRKLP